MKSLSLPRNRRLVNNAQFKAVIRNGSRACDGPIILFVSDNDCGHPRLGVSLAKACGNAVTRNRLKRFAREAFRLNQHQIPPAFDYLLMISPKWSKKLDEQKSCKESLKRLTAVDVEDAFLALIERAMQSKR